MGTSNTILQQMLNETTFTYPFRTFDTPTIAKSLSGSLRFGLSTDIVKLFGTDNEQKEYTHGLICIGTIVAIFFFWWLVLLIGFYFCGSHRVGFLSGSPFSIVQIKNENEMSTTPSRPTSCQTKKETRNSLNDQTKNDVDGPTNGNNIHDLDDRTELHPSTDDDTNPIGNTTNIHLSTRTTSMSDSAKLDEEIIDKEQKVVNKEEPEYGRTTSVLKLFSCRKCSSSAESNSVWIRRIFIGSGLVVIVFSILFITHGINQMQNAITTISLAAETTQFITSQLISSSIPTDIIDIQDRVTTAIESLVNSLAFDDICPNAASDSNVFQNVQQLQSLQVLQNLTTNALDQLDTLLNSVGDPNSTDLIDISDALESGLHASTAIHQYTSQIRMTDWKSLLFLLSYTLIPCLVISSAIIASSSNMNVPKLYHKLMVWIIFPLFIVMMLLAVAACAFGLISASANADLCSPQQYHIYTSNSTNKVHVTINTPDESVIQIIQKKGYDLQSVELQLSFFYITQCVVQNPLEQIQVYQVDLEKCLGTLHELEDHLNKSDVTDELRAVCGRSYDNLLNEQVGTVRANLSTLLEGVTSLLSTMGCEKIVPIYQAGLYDAACDKSMMATVWIFFTTLIVSIFGFVMITFRSAYSDNVYNTVSPQQSVKDDHSARKTQLLAVAGKSINDETLPCDIGSDAESSRTKQDCCSGKPVSTAVNESYEDQGGTTFVSTYLDQDYNSILMDLENIPKTDRTNFETRSSRKFVKEGNKKRTRKSQRRNISNLPGNRIFDDTISNDGHDVDDWTPCFPSETKAVGDELDKILDEMCRQRSYGS